MLFIVMIVINCAVTLLYVYVLFSIILFIYFEVKRNFLLTPYACTSR